MTLKNHSLKRKKILVVEDDPDILGLIVVRVKQLFDCDFTVDPNEALHMLQQRQYDMLITDLKMPMLSGEELILQAQAIQPELAITVISGHAELAMKTQQQLKDPNLTVLNKPIPLRDEFLQLIEKAMGSSN